MTSDVTIQKQMCELRAAVANALEMADRLGLQMVGIHLNDALECLAEATQDND